MYMKCRVYDKHLKVIRDVKYINFENQEVMYYADEFEGNEDEAGLDMVRSFNEVNLMWSTGLKDEEDKEIYEGDLIEYRDGEESFKGEVFVGCFGSYIKHDGDYTRFEDISDENTRLAGNCYVVGNIYEENND